MLARAIEERFAMGVDPAVDDDPDIDRLVHDLRGPLSVIVAFAETLEGAERHERARYTERLVANAHRALGLLEEFSALYDLRSGAIELHRSVLELGELTDSTAEVVRSESRAGCELRCLVAEGGVTLAADRDLLGMALRAVTRAILRELGGASVLCLRVSKDSAFAYLELSASEADPGRVPDPSQLPELEILQRVISLHGGRLLFDAASAESLVRAAIPLELR